MPPSRYLSEFELHVLLAVRALDNSAYGGSIRREIAGRSGRQVWIGPLYSALAKLEDQGLLHGTMGNPLPVPGGRSRRYFQLTTRGESALRQSLTMLDKMRKGAGLKTPRQA
jgi:DNA-binding PadR family transcriptional regulator